MSAAAWAVRDLRSLSGERERSELLARKDTVELACREGLELQRGEFERAELGRGCSENSIRVVLSGRPGGDRLFQTVSKVVTDKSNPWLTDEQFGFRGVG